MIYSKFTSRGMPFIAKALSVLLIICCVVIGLVGLVLPIIPGFLFLFLAALLLARISSRFKHLLHNHSTTEGWMKHWQSSKALSRLQQAKLSFWLVAKGLVASVESGVNALKKAKGDS